MMIEFHLELEDGTKTWVELQGNGGQYGNGWSNCRQFASLSEDALGKGLDRLLAQARRELEQEGQLRVWKGNDLPPSARVVKVKAVEVLGIRVRPNGYLPDPFRGRTTEELVRAYPYEFRFRDPEFIAKLDRWSQARAAWNATWPAFANEIWAATGSLAGAPISFTDEACPDHPVAREFVAARRVYLDDITSRMHSEGL